MTMKEFISPKVLFRDSFALAQKIYDSGYSPDCLVILWRGGAPVGMVIHEYFLYKGIDVLPMLVRAESYTGMRRKNEPSIENMNSISSVLKQNSRVLIVDYIYDTGNTVKKTKQFLSTKTQNIKTATLYLKNGATGSPEFFIREVSHWIVFPHEITDLSIEEIKKKDKFIHSLLA